MARKPKLPELPPRAADAHKGNFGHVLIIGGSTGMAGAAVLAGEAALRSGAGLVTIATPKSVYPIVAARTTCCLTMPLRETSAGTTSDEAYLEIKERLKTFDCIALGPGLGRHPKTTRFVHKIVAEAGAPMVIDADGLNALAGNIDLLQLAPAERIITPHPGEMSRLCGLSIDNIQSMREKVARDFAREHHCILLLKGAGSIVTDGAQHFINATGNPGMATGGTGDVLTGIIAALVGQGLSAYDAACLGAHLHGLAGDIAAKHFGQISMIATDLLHTLPEAFQSIQPLKKPRRK